MFFQKLSFFGSISPPIRESHAHPVHHPLGDAMHTRFTYSFNRDVSYSKSFLVPRSGGLDETISDVNRCRHHVKKHENRWFNRSVWKQIYQAIGMF